MTLKRIKGFTLIELLIVITIIGILAVAFLPSMLGAPAKARDTQRIAAVEKIATVLSTAAISQTLPGTDATAYCIISDGSGTVVLDPASFGGKVPTDPQTTNGPKIGSVNCATTGEYMYIKKPVAGYSFGIYAKLENAANSNVTCTVGTFASMATATTITTTTVAADACYGLLIQ